MPALTNPKLLFPALAALLIVGSAAATELTPCGDESQSPRSRCGKLSVPEDRGRTDGRRIDLSVVVVPAAQASGLEPVFMLAGGPGQAARDLEGLVRGPYATVNETRDFILVDQRGTGGSNPLPCLNGADADPQASFGGLFKPDEMAACFAELRERADLDFYSTPHVVADLEAVRAWLGYERVVLWGASGGTRTALVWMREHPDRVVAALLDGLTPTSFRAPSTMARSAHDSLESVFEDCMEQESCRTAFPDLETDFRKVLWIFESGPVKTRVTREDGTVVEVTMTRDDLAYALRAMLYAARRIAPLPKLIHETAATGDVSPFAQALWMRDVALRPAVAMGVHFGVYCAEDLPFIDSREVKALTEGTFIGTYLMDQYGAICELLGIEAQPRGYLAPTTADIPTLLFSGHYDPTTPPGIAAEVDRHLPNSRHVVVRNEAHGAEFGCARPAAIQFLKTGSLEGLGPICEDTGAIEFEVN